MLGQVGRERERGGEPGCAGLGTGVGCRCWVCWDLRFGPLLLFFFFFKPHNQFEFKFKFEFNPNTQSKIKQCTSMNAQTS
jgi:hypothetical protein